MSRSNRDRDMTRGSDVPFGVSSGGVLPHAMSTPRRVGRNTGFLVAGELVSKAASFVFYAVMARAIGQEGFGGFTFALSLALLLAAFDTGVDPVVTRAIARRREDV